jgi:hypothetical protein
MRLAFKPVALSIAFASILYIFVMPRLSSFTELGWLIFAVTFAICYLFYKPQQILGRVAGLAIFFTMAGISNAQSYSFLSLANTTLMFVLVFMILALAAYVPFSPHHPGRTPRLGAAHQAVDQGQPARQGRRPPVRDRPPHLSGGPG